MIPVIVLDAARKEIFDGSDYYDMKEPGLGAEFIDVVERALDLLAEWPYLGSKTKRGARRFVLRRFPYSIIYRTPPGKLVVVAVAHHRREAYYWQNRK